jgi:hypothetical protein
MFSSWRNRFPKTIEGPLLGGPNQAAQITGFARALSTFAKAKTGRFSCG